MKNSQYGSQNKREKPRILWVFHGFSIKIQFATIGIFVISTSKYKSIQNFKKIRGEPFSEVYPNMLLNKKNQSEIQKIKLKWLGLGISKVPS